MSSSRIPQTVEEARALILKWERIPETAVCGKTGWDYMGEQLLALLAQARAEQRKADAKIARSTWPKLPRDASRLDGIERLMVERMQVDISRAILRDRPAQEEARPH